MKKRKKTLLWRLEVPEASQPSYLFGTMHVRDRRAFRYKEQVYRCIEACEALATEFNLDEMATQADPSLVQLPGDLTLDQLMTNRQYDKLRRILLKTIRIDIHFLRHVRPLVISNLIDEHILNRDQSLAMDEHLWHYARDRGKRLYGIETYQEQLAIMQQIPLKYQVDALLWTGRHIRRHRRQLLHLTRIYRSGDIYLLYQVARRGAHGLRKLLLYNRNHIMAARIHRIILEQTTLCAIGAGHLAGGQGVLRLLKQRGIVVKPVTIEPMAGF